MTEQCPYVEKFARCPVSPVVAELAGNPCRSNEHGNEICGQIAVRNILDVCAERLVSLDAERPIVGTFIIELLGETVDKEEIGFIVGVELPVRYPEKLKVGEFEVSFADLAMGLLLQGKIDPAYKYTQADFTNPSTLTLRRHIEYEQAETTSQSPVGSWDYFTPRINPAINAIVDTSAERGAN